MKLFIKQNKFVIVIIILLLIWFSIGIKTYVDEYGYKARLKSLDTYVEHCYEYNYIDNDFLREPCKTAISDQKNFDRVKYMDDTLTVFYTILTSHQMFYISLIIPILVMICAIESFHKQLKTGFIKNKIMREKYSTVMLKSFIKSYKKVFLFIGILLIVLFASYLISGHFEYHEGVNSYKENIRIYDFFPVFLINILLHYIFYMNIALVMCKKNRNFFIAIILSFLTWLGIAIVTEIIVPKHILWNIFKLKFSADTFNLLAIYAWRIEDGIMLPFYVSIVLCCLSFAWLWITYRKKESVVLACEE